MMLKWRSEEANENVSNGGKTEYKIIAIRLRDNTHKKKGEEKYRIARQLNIK